MNGLKVREVIQVPAIAGGYIFNTPEFQSLKSGEVKNFALFENDIALGRISFTIDKSKAISGHQATFGSFDSQSTLSKEMANYFIDKVCKSLKDDGTKDIIIKHWPANYGSTTSFEEIFEKAGFMVMNSELNQHLVVEEKDFQEIIKKNERKKLNQCIKNEYTFKILSAAALKEVFDLVTNTRTRKGYPVSMTIGDLERAIKSMPDKYILFGLFDNKKLIAASVSIRVSKEILYNFYHADEFSYRSTSPLVMLVQEIYQYCQQNKIKILDLGISSQNGEKNVGLFTFKENLGCISANKNTYQLSYD